MWGCGAESILHGVVAASVTGLLLRAHRRDPPGIRLGFLLLGAVLPVLSAPVFRALAPGRLDPAFRDGPALFSASHFALLQVTGVPLLSALLTLLALAGTLLFLRDLVPFLVDASRWRTRVQPVADTGAIAVAVKRAAAGLGIAPPRVLLFASEQPVLLCRGLIHPRIVASIGILVALTPDELEAAVAHEVAHAAHRDPLLGWGLMLVRGLGFFNPAVQLLARAAVHETELRADRTAVGVLGGSESLVGSLRKMSGVNPTTAEGRKSVGHDYGHGHGHPLRGLRDGQPTPPAPECFALARRGNARGFFTSFVARMAQQAHARSLAARCLALQALAATAAPAGRWHLAVVVAGLTVLLYLVVA